MRNNQCSIIFIIISINESKTIQVPKFGTCIFSQHSYNNLKVRIEINMATNGIKNQILEAIKNRGIFYKYNGYELVTKCPFCGDNDRPDDGHLYIQLNMDNDSPVLYHCFKCNEGGLFTKRTLEELGIDNEELSYQLNSNGNRYNSMSYKKNDIRNYNLACIFHYKN